MSRHKKTTIKQVAEHAGVSPMTVSNFVNGRFDLMSDRMRERVAKSVKELNYRRNFGAHALRTSQAWSIGLIVVDRSDEFLADGYTTQIVSGFSNYLNRNGYSVLLQGVKPEDFDNSNIIRNLQTDGIGVLFSGDIEARTAQFRTICSLDQPTVLFLEDFEDDTHRLCSVKQDEKQGGRELANVVLSRAPRHVVILTSGLNEWAAVNERISGICETLEGAGDVRDVHVVPCGDTWQDDVQTALTAHIAEHGVPDAIMGINDYIALAAISHLKSLNLSVPGDCCVTGFNAFQLHKLSDPTLTTVQSPAYEMGQTGARALLKCLEGTDFDERVITFPGTMVRGNSA